MDQLLKILQNNARLSLGELSVMTGLTEKEVGDRMEQLEADGVIRGYKTIINWDTLDVKNVSALIEIKVTPKLGHGFDEIAERITRFEEVESVYLMSGAYDLAVMVKGRTFQDVAMFVAKRLSPMDSVLSTATHFLLRRYKDVGIAMNNGERDDRGTVSL